MCLLVVFFFLAAVGLSACSKKSTSDSKWAKQGVAIKKVGLVLWTYLQKHDNKMPANVRALKAWADSTNEYKSLSTSPIWLFVSPNDNKSLEWKIGDQSKNVYLYAPEICVRNDGVAARLVLQRFDIKYLRYNFMEESVFKKLKLEPSHDM